MCVTAQIVFYFHLKKNVVIDPTIVTVSHLFFPSKMALCGEAIYDTRMQLKIEIKSRMWHFFPFSLLLFCLFFENNANGFQPLRRFYCVLGAIVHSFIRPHFCLMAHDQKFTVYMSYTIYYHLTGARDVTLGRLHHSPHLFSFYFFFVLCGWCAYYALLYWLYY